MESSGLGVCVCVVRAYRGDLENAQRMQYDSGNLGTQSNLSGAVILWATETRCPGCGLESDWKPVCRKVIWKECPPAPPSPPQVSPKDQQEWEPSWRSLGKVHYTKGQRDTGLLWERSIWNRHPPKPPRPPPPPASPCFPILCLECSPPPMTLE